MKKYMAMYMAPAATIGEMMKATPDQMKAGMDDWMKWAGQHKDAIVDRGAPLGKTKRVTGKGTSDTKNEITGYTIVQADDAASAAKIFAQHPHLRMNGASVDLLECVDLDSM